MNKILEPGTIVFHRNLQLKGVVLAYHANVPNNLDNHGTFVKFVEDSPTGEIQLGDIREVSTNLLDVLG